jgi:xanthine dehydrogenase accessory factor
MPERRRIVDLARTGSPQVLVTLVRIEGSSYRRPGARLLLAANGQYAGTISGGCLETEVTRKAAWITRTGAAVERYSTLFDDTADIPFGLGCGGTVDLLFEPADTPEAHALLNALEQSLNGAEAEILTWLPTPATPLRRAVLDAAGKILFQSPSLTPEDLANPDEASLYREHLYAPQRLILIGAGDDARPVAAMANLLGWNVTIADGRAHLASRDRFPEVQQVLTLDHPRDLVLTGKDAVVLMTHSYEQDREALATLLVAQPICYLGILGARHRTALLVAEASALAGRSIAETCARIHAPIGLDLGGDGPEAIALAIVAEIQAATQGKLPASRRLTPANVAEQIERGGATRYLTAQCALNEVEPVEDPA